MEQGSTVLLNIIIRSIELNITVISIVRIILFQWCSEQLTTRLQVITRIIFFRFSLQKKICFSTLPKHLIRKLFNLKLDSIHFALKLLKFKLKSKFKVF